MPFIKTQKLVLSNSGTGYLSGTASIIDTVYDKSVNGYSRHKVREKLGKVIWLSDDHRSGIFNSQTRGLVSYDAEKDTFSVVDRNDSRISDIKGLFLEPRVHTTFGDAFLLLRYMQDSGLISILRKSFPDDILFEKVIAHIVYGVIEQEDHGHCDEFMQQSFVSYLLTDIPILSLGSDSSYYKMMGDDKNKLAFFKDFIEKMRENHPEFGNACYVDSTPLPGDAKDNPFNHLCSHGTGETCTQTRLVLVLDAETGLPVWYSVIPGNVLDMNTIEKVEKDLGISVNLVVESLVLDAGYAVSPLFEKYNIKTFVPTENGIGKHYMIVRMPNRQGYPHDALYDEVKPMIHYPPKEIIRNGHSYFAHMIKTEVREYPEYCYVFVDKDNMLTLARKDKLEHPEKWEKLIPAEMEKREIEFGFFILISNKEAAPGDILEEYFGRCTIESVFKSAKEYLSILPIAKWDKTKVLGKILSDSIRTIVYLMFRSASKNKSIDVGKMLRKSQALNCIKNGEDQAIVETAGKQIREFFDAFGYTVPAVVNLNEIRNDLLSGKEKGTDPEKAPKKKRGPKPKLHGPVPMQNEENTPKKRGRKPKKETAFSPTT